MMTAPLPDGLTIHNPIMADAEAVTELLNACAIAEYGAPAYTPEDVRSTWGGSGPDQATDAWVIVSSAEQVVGYAALWRWSGLFFSEAYVHPQQRSRGIGNYLLGLIEARAIQSITEAPAGAPRMLRQEISSGNQAGHQLLALAGYTITRHTWRMEIELTEAPPTPAWPAGITIRAFVSGQHDRTVHAVVEEAFQQNRGHIPIPFEDWAQFMIQYEQFDPTLWFLAMDGAEIAGVALCRKRQEAMETGRVTILAVRRPWRQKGLGMALLRQAFGEFYQRGIHQVSLTVDSENITGAVRLYERAGMHIARQYSRYEKKLNPGVV
jgi:mycothiol synthase